MLDRVSGLVAGLRVAGVEISLGEGLDAVRALGQLDLADGRSVRAALRATLVKRPEQRDLFDALFDLWFSPPLYATTDTPAAGDDLAARLQEALRAGDRESLSELARQAAALPVEAEPGRPAGSAYRLFRALGRLDAPGAIQRILAAARLGPFEEELARRRMEALAGVLQEDVQREIRRLDAAAGRPASPAELRRLLPAEVDFLSATPQELAALRRALRPLARRLATRLARRRRRRRHGQLDFRATIRRSLSAGGVPVDPRFRSARPARPELVVLADVSGSVAGFARFTLQLVHALAGQFSRVQSFVFVDGIDEVTSVLRRSDDLARALARVDAEADVVGAAGHSDYGRALEAFLQGWGREVTARTSVVVLGDARNNYHPARTDVLEEIHRRARRLWWLNPEPRSFWDTGDSVASLYASCCDGMYECRNLRQLEDFVAATA